MHTLNIPLWLSRSLSLSLSLYIYIYIYIRIYVYIHLFLLRSAYHNWIGSSHNICPVYVCLCILIAPATKANYFLAKNATTWKPRWFGG